MGEPRTFYIGDKVRRADMSSLDLDQQQSERVRFCVGDELYVEFEEEPGLWLFDPDAKLVSKYVRASDGAPLGKFGGIKTPPLRHDHDPDYLEGHRKALKHANAILGAEVE